MATVEVHQLSKEPDDAWQLLRKNITSESLKPLSLETPVYEDLVRFVCVSDTHSMLARLTLPPGDVLIHAGDFSNVGLPKEIASFNDALGKLPHKHKVVIAGNHELSFDPQTCYRAGNRDPIAVKSLLTNCIYLEDSVISTLYGYNIYGSPWQPEFMGWAFNVPRGYACLQIWRKIPTNTHILITHGPPVGFCDELCTGKHVGCVDLLNVVRNRVKPMYHIFGHIHEAYGVKTDGRTTFINAATCNRNYRPVNPPVIFDLPLPEGTHKIDSISTFAKTDLMTPPIARKTVAQYTRDPVA